MKTVDHRLRYEIGGHSSRTVAGCVIAAAAILLLGAGCRAAGDGHGRVLTLVTHSSPGGGSDVFLREMAPYLARIMGVRIVVDNLAGGSGAKAMAVISKAGPDGGMFYATTPTFIYTSLLSTPAVDYQELEPLVNLFFDPEVLYTAANSRFTTLQDILDHARQSRGKWGAGNPASLERQTLEQLKRKAGVNAAVVSFEGGGDMLVNVLNQTLDMGIGDLDVKSQEIQLTGGRGKIDWLAGVYY